MGKPGTRKRPRTRREILQYGRELGGVTQEGKKHTKIYNPHTNESVTVPRHNTLNRHTATGIVVRLKLMFGITIVLLIPICLVIWLIAGLNRM